VNIEDLKEKDYLGDGVYCGFDGFQIWIWTSNGVRESEAIALEPYTLLALHRYMVRITPKKDEA